MTRREDARATVGIGFKAEHAAEIGRSGPAVGWFEVHPENYMVAGGPRLARLDRLRADYPVSLHAVGLSLGSVEPVDADRLRRLSELTDRVEPMLVSDHLSWSGIGGVLVPDLLPLPCTEEALGVVADNLGRVQNALGRPILIENPSLYLRPEGSTMKEADFLAALVRRTGCGLLLDVNNLFVTTSNIGGYPADFLDALPAEAIGEIHLAGHKSETLDTGTVLIDDHGSRVADPVWELYREALRRFGPRPTLIEWDTDVPPLSTLLDEASTAADMIAATETGDDRAA